MLKSIQLDDKFIEVSKENLSVLKEQLQNKELVAFNSPFEQAQLSRAGFDVWSNHWLQNVDLEQQLDIRLDSKKSVSLKGWSSGKLKSEYIKKYKPHWLEYLELTPKTKKVKFDSNAKELLMKHFPEDRILKLAYDISKRNRAIEQIRRLFKYADR